MRVFINNKEQYIVHEKISFSTVVVYGLSNMPRDRRMVPTVTYRYAHGKENHTMQAKSSIRIQEGMHFSVINGKRVLEGNPIIETPVERKPLPIIKTDTLAARGSHLTDAGARLKDCYIILNLLYADLVGAGLFTKGREMAGRLLYSNGYLETVKVLEEQ